MNPSGPPARVQLKQMHIRTITARWFVAVVRCGVEVKHCVVLHNEPVHLQDLSGLQLLLVKRFPSEILESQAAQNVF